MIEKILGHLDADDTESRIELAQVSEPGEQPRLEMRMQRQSGEQWITIRRIRLGAGQVPAMKMALQFMDSDALAPAPTDATDNVFSLADYRAIAV